MNVKCNKQTRINGTWYFKSEDLMFNAVFTDKFKRNNNNQIA